MSAAGEESHDHDPFEVLRNANTVLLHNLRRDDASPELQKQLTTTGMAPSSQAYFCDPYTNSYLGPQVSLRFLPPRYHRHIFEFLEAAKPNQGHNILSAERIIISAALPGTDMSLPGTDMYSYGRRLETTAVSHKFECTCRRTRTFFAHGASVYSRFPVGCRHQSMHVNVFVRQPWLFGVFCLSASQRESIESRIHKCTHFVPLAAFP